MIEFPVDVLWIIKTMFLRSLWNPNAFVYMIKTIIYSYYLLFFLIIICIIIIFLFRNIKKNWKNKKTLLEKNNIKKVFIKEKNFFKVLNYPIIWCILIWTYRIHISLFFWLFSIYYKTQLDVTIWKTLPAQEYWMLWMWTTYSSLFFVVAWYFIWLSFWNKMLRNIWILIYVLWILFILLMYFLAGWAITNDLPNFTV